MTLEEIKSKLEEPNPFGTDNPKKVYRELVKQLHPDTTEQDTDEVKQLFQQLEAAWNKFNNVVPTKTWTISTRKHDYVVTDLLSKSPITNDYKIKWLQDTEEQEGIIRIPRSPKNSDLMDAEAKALKLLHAQAKQEFQPYFPQLEECFKYRDKNTKIDRRVHVIQSLPDGLISVEELHNKMPNMNPRDVAWIFRRLLTAIGAAHEVGIINGAIVPSTVMIQPAQHGVMLINWQFSSTDRPIKAVPTAPTLWYPPEILRKQIPSPATDIYMAARMHDYLTGYVPGRDGKALRAFMNSCWLDSQRARPDDAWKLLKEYTYLIERLWGPRKFRKLEVPTN